MQGFVVALVACLMLGGAGCSYNPHFKADVIGLGDLPHQVPGLPSLPDADSLPKLMPGIPRPAYRIGPLDQITVLVWGRPDLGSQVPSERESQRRSTTVATDGTITLPFLEPLHVADKTVSEVTELIREGYARIVATPIVETEVVVYRSRGVQLQGEVVRPGTVYLTDNSMALGETMTAVGGTTGAADTRNAVLIRDGVHYHLDEWAARRGLNDALDVLLQSGDLIYFPSRDERVFQVLGDVRNQGAYPIPDRGITLVEGLAAAGGPNLDSANIRRVFLLRQREGGTTVYRFDLSELMAAGDVPVFPGDRLYVTRSGLWYWGNAWRHVLPVMALANAAYFIDRIFE
jgi:polysaccharide export outer membrane protein